VTGDLKGFVMKFLAVVTTTLPMLFGFIQTATADDAANTIGDLGTRAIAVMQDGDTAAVVQGRFRQLFRQYFDADACGRFALGPRWQTATIQQRQEFTARYEDYIVITYSTFLSHIRGESFKVMGSTPMRKGSS
jgi:ABC-type transporter MlaC component